KIYSLKAENGEVISKKGVMPDMKNIPAPVADAGHVPDVRGLGVMDAVYELENAGYKVVWHGNGHVSRQDPASGTKYTEGNTVTLELK
ncbi:MAG: PASTA domain-containing protein, partial [Bacteroidales bacterium]|nr:PASTA domain-containing protein [Bacteroidales bacterium]